MQIPAPGGAPWALADLLATLAEDASAAAAASMSDVAVEYLARASHGEGPVSRQASAASVAGRFDEPMPAHGRPMVDVIQRLRDDVVRDANRLSHPMYLGHQVSPPLPIAVWSEAVISALNNSLAVMEMSPTLTIVERRVIRWMCELVAFGPASGGTFTSGGTEATLASLLAARASLLPGAWEDGVGASPPLVLCGAHAHYAVARAVGAMGIGVRQVVRIPTVDHRMDPAALATTLGRLREEERPVLAVVATSGHTATGSFDDLERIADACADHGVWLHVDAAHGASALLSPSHRHRMRGIERADSLAWDPHKMMLMPLAAGMVLVRDERVLDRAFAQQAPYLFHEREGEPSWDTGLRSLQCSRRADALKVWVALQRYGASGMAAFYDHLVALTRALHQRLARHPRFEPLHEPECNILCFRFVGEKSLGEEALDTLNRELRERYNRSGEGWITATDLDGRRVLRVTIMNPRTTEQHLDRLVEGLDDLGQELARSNPTAAAGRS